MNEILKVLTARKNIRYQVYFWLSIYLILAINFSYTGWNVALFIAFLNLLFDLPTVYINLLVFYPKYLKNKDLKWYVPIIILQASLNSVLFGSLGKLMVHGFFPDWITTISKGYFQEADVLTYLSMNFAEAILILALSLFVVTNRVVSRQKKLKSKADKLERLSQLYDVINTGEQILSKLGGEGGQANVNNLIEELVIRTESYLQKLLNISSFSIGVYDDYSDAIFFPIIIEKGERKNSIEFELQEEQLATYCYKKQKEVIIDDLTKDLNRYLTVDDTTGLVLEKGKKSVLYYPLTVESKQIGVLFLQSEEAFAYAEKDLDLLKPVFNNIAIAINNALAYEQINQQKNELEKISAELMMISAVIGHDVKNRLLTLKSLRLAFEDQLLSDEGKKLHTLMIKVTDSINHTFMNLLNWVDIESAEIKPKLQSVNGRLMVDKLLEELHPLADKKALNLFNRLDFGFEFMADEQMIRVVFRNLIHNAVKFTLEGGDIRIEGAYIQAEGKEYAEIKVVDSGPGMTEKDQERLFELDIDRSIIGHLDKDSKGSGLGLIFVQKFINAMQGKIFVESQLGNGATFTIHLPKSS